MLARRAFVSMVPAIAAGLMLAQIAGHAAAAPAADPMAFVDGLVAQALDAAKDQAVAGEREQRLAALVHDDFDMPRISRFVLGRYWLAASDQEKEDFQKLFETYVVRAFSNRFNQYAGQTVKLTGSRPEGDSGAVIISEIISPQGGPHIRLDWRVRKAADDYRIVDVDVEGVSMVLTQRQEFAAVAERRGGVKGLNQAIKERLNGTLTARQ